ncbi:MAG: hypothetical protein P8171_04760 [Candidatus Thiodiazotropha sp.]
MTHSMFKKVTNTLYLLVLLSFLASASISSFAYAGDRFLVKTKVNECPAGWVRSSAPGGCSPGYFTLKLAGIENAKGCPKGWVDSSAPGGCSPGFFTLYTNGLRDSQRSCPDGWVRSSAPGGCSPEFLTLKLAGLKAVNECPKGWVRSSAPGGCSPGSFTLEPGFDGVDRAYFHCAFGDFCDDMIDSIIALGGTCDSSGDDTTCNLPPLVDEDE